MPYMTNWFAVRSGTGLRVTGTYFDGVSCRYSGYKLTGVSRIEVDDGKVWAVIGANKRVRMLLKTGDDNG